MEKRNIIKLSILIVIFAVLSTIGVRKAEAPREDAMGEDKTVKTEQILEWGNITKNAPWSPRDSHTSFVFDNKIWLIGGISGDDLVNKNHFIPYWKAPHFNDVWNSEDGLNWNKVDTKKIWPPRRSMNVVEVDGRLWMFGGWSPQGGYTSDLWNSDDGINWKLTDIKLPWEPREGQVVEYFDGRVWAMGGVNYDKRKTFNDVWSSFDGENWQEATSSAPWSGRWDFSLAVFNEKIYLMGGMDLKDNEFNDVWSTEDGKNWTLVTSAAPWATRQGHSSISMGDRLWMFGRLNDSDHVGPNDMWSTEDGINWREEGELPWDGREDFTTVVFNDKIYIMGGMGQDWTWRNDVWSAELSDQSRTPTGVGEN